MRALVSLLSAATLTLASGTPTPPVGSHAQPHARPLMSSSGSIEGQGGNQAGSGNPIGGGPGDVSPGDIRQFRREIRERVQEAQELQQILEEENLETLDSRQLDEVVSALRQLDR